MATYSIPKEFIEGFKNIIKLSEDDMNSLSSTVSALKIAEDFDEILENNISNFSSVSAGDLHSILRSLVSVVNIFQASYNDIEDFTNTFSNSYLFSVNDAKEEDKAVLKKRLSILLNNSNNLISTVKSQDLLTENQRNFRECRVITDIRMLFNTDMESSDKHAVIVHNLKVEYFENRLNKEFFVALDLSDLKKLKVAVDRAIEKDRIIKNQQHTFNFIDF